MQSTNRLLVANMGLLLRLTEELYTVEANTNTALYWKQNRLKTQEFATPIEAFSSLTWRRKSASPLWQSWKENTRSGLGP